MYRSFTDRVLGGVCGGIADRLPIGSWALRILFVLLAIATLGAVALAYAILWVVVPQQRAGRDRGGFLWFILAFGVLVLTVAGWAARLNGQTVFPGGSDLYYPVLVTVLALAIFLRQLRGTS